MCSFTPLTLQEGRLLSRCRACCGPKPPGRGVTYCSAPCRAQGPSRHISSPTAKLTVGQVREIRARHAAGTINQVGLAQEYGVAKGTISHLLRGLTWRGVR